MANNIRRLKDEADIRLVINYLGIPVTKKGNAYFVLCPQPDHDDIHATNCFFKDGWNHVYCLACGKTTFAVDLIVYTLGCEYGEACDILWDLCGRPDWYYDNNEMEKDTHYTISYEEANFIGLHLPNRINCPYQETSIKKETENQTYVIPSLTRYSLEENDENTYILCNTQYCHWGDFATEGQMAAIVIDKAIEKKNIFLEMAGITGWKELKNICMDMAKRCEEIITQALLFAG